jgi:hypothetical protein
MTAPHPIGSTIPVQPWLIESIQQNLASKPGGAVHQSAVFKQHLVQRFGAWRVFPVRVGRWMRDSYLSEYGEGGWALILAPVLLPWRPGLWKLNDSYVQVLDPSSGMPIAELNVSGWGSRKSDAENEWRQTRQLAILGDPRVGGLVAPVQAASTTEVYQGNRRGHRLSWDPARFDQLSAQLVNEPYRDFADRNDGPWLADQPQKPQGGTNGWKPSPWYRPS